VTWSDLFERAGKQDVTVERIADALAREREERSGEGTTDRLDADIDVDPMARVVADADVLAADLLTGEASREALDIVAGHDWIELVASEALLADAEAVLGEIAGAELAGEWRARIDDLTTLVGHTGGDHPALAAALHGDARHVLSLDDRLQSAGAGTVIRREANVETSVRSPDAFARLFDPASVYETIYGGHYPGPDHESRGGTPGTPE
jgi:hypothetical protein